MTKERRKHIRTPFEARVKLVHPSAGEVEFVMRDLSDGGIFLYTGDQVELAVGDRVKVQALDIENAPILEAEVVRREDTGVGLMFTEV